MTNNELITLKNKLNQCLESSSCSPFYHLEPLYYKTLQLLLKTKQTDKIQIRENIGNFLINYFFLAYKHITACQFSIFEYDQTISIAFIDYSLKTHKYDFDLYLNIYGYLQAHINYLETAQQLTLDRIFTKLNINSPHASTPIEKTYSKSLDIAQNLARNVLKAIITNCGLDYEEFTDIVKIYCSTKLNLQRAEEYICQLYRDKKYSAIMILLSELLIACEHKRINPLKLASWAKIVYSLINGKVLRQVNDLSCDNVSTGDDSEAFLINCFIFRILRYIATYKTDHERNNNTLLSVKVYCRIGFLFKYYSQKYNCKASDVYFVNDYHHSLHQLVQYKPLDKPSVISLLRKLAKTQTLFIYNNITNTNFKSFYKLNKSVLTLLYLPLLIKLHFAKQKKGHHKYITSAGKANYIKKFVDMFCYAFQDYFTNNNVLPLNEQKLLFLTALVFKLSVKCNNVNHEQVVSFLNVVYSKLSNSSREKFVSILASYLSLANQSSSVQNCLDYVRSQHLDFYEKTALSSMFDLPTDRFESSIELTWEQLDNIELDLHSSENIDALQILSRFKLKEFLKVNNIITTL